MSILKSMIIGAIAGTAVALGGAIKDSPYEGFDWLTFIRSPIIGAIEAPIIARAFREDKKDIHPGLLFLSTIATERITVEGYKIVRVQMPGKFRVGEWGVPKERIS